MPSEIVYHAPWVLLPSGLTADAWVRISLDGTVLDTGTGATQGAELQQLQGLLIPGWVNAHTHLELSHLSGRVVGGEGMAGFVRSLMPLRDQFSVGEQEAACMEAVADLQRTGTAAVGDIANGTVSFAAKAAHPELPIHSFTEVFGLDPTEAARKVAAGLELVRACPPPASLTLHAPYSCPPELVAAMYAAHSGPYSLHLLESAQEREYVEQGTGPLAELFAGWGAPALRPLVRDAIAHLLDPMPAGRRALLIHLTELTSADRAQLAAHAARGLDLYEVLCPASNLYLHGKLPDPELFDWASGRVCLGTDSLASAPSLDLLGEVKLLAERWPEVPTEALLRAATVNGARALGFDDLGELRVGTRPRLLQLHPVASDSRPTRHTACTVLA